MQDDKMIQEVINTTGAKSIAAVQSTKSGQPGESAPAARPVARRKLWSSVGLPAIISLAAIALILYLLRNVPAAKLEGLGAGLCVIAFGGFLLSRLVRGMEEEDKLEEELRSAGPATLSLSESKPENHEMNPTMPPPEAGQNMK
jgi:hypothetical protein